MTSTPFKYFGPLRGLSRRVLGLTILFVMLGEVLIFLPSIANFRIQWMKARIAQAEIAALAAEAAPNEMLDEQLRTEILKGAGVTAVSLQKGDTRKLVLRNDDTREIAQSYDLRSGMHYLTIGEALKLLARQNDRVISVRDFPPNMSGELIDVSLHEKPLREAMLRFGLNIFGLSIALSLIVASMIFAALNQLMVRPMQRLTENMFAFAEKPDDVQRIVEPSGRADEIGMVERELKSMQTQIQGMLSQKEHLVSLGLAVAKVSHDLRNMLTSAQLISDRLADVKDPTVQKLAPKLLSSLDRAIDFLNETLRYGRAQEQPPRRERLKLAAAVSEVLEQMLPMAQGIGHLHSNISGETTIDADHEQLNRILTNLIRNALDAFRTGHGAFVPPGIITISARSRNDATAIHVDDNGPGIPAAIRGKLFQAFQSADRQGGTGLGLAIVAELVRGHGGSIEVAHTGESGTSFVVTIPHFKALASAKVIVLPRADAK
jgi:signal transduction histidine kinase